MDEGPIDSDLRRKDASGYTVEAIGRALIDQALVKGAAAAGAGAVMPMEARIDWAARPKPRAVPGEPREPAYLSLNDES